MGAQRRVGDFSLAGTARELHTSCAPCAMCLGAVHWSGVERLVCGATREDAEALGFDEGPVFEQSYRYLEQHGVGVEHGVRRAEAATVLRDYPPRGGVIYNP
jgi:tRNA(Arg) A34 adenosine deaminase TadA